MTVYVLTEAADADLVGILRYTRKRWSAAQARTYIAKLTRGMETLAAGAGAYKAMNEIHPGLRMNRCEHHLIFCLMRDTGEPPVIVALFHERMDLMARLTDRLE